MTAFEAGRPRLPTRLDPDLEAAASRASVRSTRPRAYAERAFGVFHEEPLEVAFRFAPSAAPDARAFLVHLAQTSSDEPDGSLTVRFRVRGVLEIAHHLLTWRLSVTIVAPKALKDRMRETRPGRPCP
jgi:predicted DNA-binding transcriptional regulator YafY